MSDDMSKAAFLNYILPLLALSVDYQEMEEQFHFESEEAMPVSRV